MDKVELTDQHFELTVQHFEVADLARQFVHNWENWETYQDLKGSKSLDIPVEFMNLCEKVEELFGPPKKED